MAIADDEYIDSIQFSLDEIERDSTEAADFEFENLHSLVTGEVAQQRKSSLMVKLEADPTQGFSVTDYSLYRDDRWVLEKAENSNILSILFNSDVVGGNHLKKMLVYHLIPQFHPFGRIRSFFSTTTYAYAFRYLEEYLLLPNGIDATPDSIRVISARMINEALDKSRDQGSPRQYFLFYFIATFWVALSNLGLISLCLRLDIPLRLIDTNERQKDIRNEIASEHKGWSPFTEEELSRLIEYAFFWAEKAVPVLLDIKRFIKEEGLLDSQYRHVIRSHRFQEFEDVMNRKVDGTTICGFKLNRPTNKVVHNGNIYQYELYHYRWQRKFKEAVDRVRDGILIFVALITGMRRTELGILTFDDITQNDDGEWQINITRFKTSDNPNYFGESDLIPIPTFIGSMVNDYKDLRNFHNNMRSGLLFEQIANPRQAKILNRAVGRAISSLGNAVGVDSVHPHRFRKTIAEILINRSERNIDLIRMLFGHKSYTMTLRYIARNPYLVHSIAETIETHFAEAFVEIVAAVRNGAFSGAAAERIANSTATRPELFKGRLLRLTVYNYIAYLLEAGEPVFIQRTGVGIYCFSSDAYCKDTAPPCVGRSEAKEGNIVPDPSNCQLDCQNAIVLEGARDTLDKNIAFYSRLLDQASGSLTKTAQKQLTSKISINERHLAALNQRKNAQAVDEAKMHS